MEVKESKLRKILREEKITQASLHEEIDKYFDPGVESYIISGIVSGKKANSTITTYAIILAVLNKVSGKKYTLGDIVDFNIIKKRLKNRK